MRLAWTFAAVTLYCFCAAIGFILWMWGANLQGISVTPPEIAADRMQPWLYSLYWLPHRIPFLIDWKSSPIASIVRLELCAALILCFFVFLLRGFRFISYLVIGVATVASVIVLTFGIREYRHGRYIDEHFGSGAPPAQIHRRPIEEKPDYIKRLQQSYPEWDPRKTPRPAPSPLSHDSNGV